MSRSAVASQRCRWLELCQWSTFAQRSSMRRRSKTRPQSGGVKRPEVGRGGKPDRSRGPPSIPRVFCGTQEGCIRVELYAAVRRSVYVEGLSERAAARRFGLARETVRKMLRTAGRPGIAGRNRSGVRSWTPSRGSLIRSSARISPGRRSNGTRPSVGERGTRGVRVHGRRHDRESSVRAQRLGGQEMFVPLAHPPGDAKPTSAKRWS